MESHLLQMRGLKLLKISILLELTLSHLLQMRGLKQSSGHCVHALGVASFTDAWIETIRIRNIPFPRLVASFTDAWIETPALPLSVE